MARLYQEVALELLRELGEHRLVAGDRLPKEIDLAAERNVSRTVARQCIQSLAERDVVRVQHGRGAWVLDERSWDVLDPDIAVTLVTTAARDGLVDELIAARALVAPEIAVLAAGQDVEARTALNAPFATLQAGHRRALRRDDHVLDAELEFLSAVRELAGNRVLARALAPLDIALCTARHRIRTEDEDDVATMHKALHDAIVGGSRAEARAAAAEATRRLAVSLRA